MPAPTAESAIPARIRAYVSLRLDEQESICRETRSNLKVGGVSGANVWLVWTRVCASAMRQPQQPAIEIPYADIARATGLQDKTITRALAELQRQGFIAVTQVGGHKGRGRSSQYRVCKGLYSEPARNGTCPSIAGPATPPSGPATPPSGPATPPSGPATPPSGPATPPSGPATPPSGVQNGTPPSGLRTVMEVAHPVGYSSLLSDHQFPLPPHSHSGECACPPLAPPEPESDDHGGELPSTCRPELVKGDPLARFSGERYLRATEAFERSRWWGTESTPRMLDILADARVSETAAAEMLERWAGNDDFAGSPLYHPKTAIEACHSRNPTRDIMGVRLPYFSGELAEAWEEFYRYRIRRRANAERSYREYLSQALTKMGLKEQEIIACLRATVAANRSSKLCWPDGTPVV